MGPFFSKMTYAASAALVDKDDYSTVHLIWLEFFHGTLYFLAFTNLFLERFKVMKNAGSLVLNLFVKLFHISTIHLNMMRYYFVTPFFSSFLAWILLVDLFSSA